MRILFVRSGGLGDFILSLPVLAALRRTWPAARIEILGKPAIAALALGGNYADSVRSIDEARFARLFSNGRLESADPLAGYLSEFDFAISFLGTPDSAFGQKIGSLIRRVIFIAAPSSGNGHACLQFVRQLEPLGITGQDWRPTIHLEPEVRERACRRLREALGARGGRVILIHPGSGSPRKNWPGACFAALISELRSAGFDVALIEGEADRAAVGGLQATLEPATAPVLQNLRLLDLAGALAEACLFVGNDSGVTHLAASLDRPVVCLFGPTDPSIWAPVCARAQVLEMSSSPDRVFSATLDLLERG